MAAFADVLTMTVDDTDEAIQERRTAGRAFVALAAVHSAVFEPLTCHKPACYLYYKRALALQRALPHDAHRAPGTQCASRPLEVRTRTPCHK
jgi:hypothetical protein